MNILSFNFKTKKITALVDEFGKIWFIAKELCDVLKYKNTSDIIKSHCLPKGISSGYTLTGGGKQKSTLIDEPNLYRLVMRSKQKNAVSFQNWVVEEVLPSIRKTGSYSIPKELKKESTKVRNSLTSTWQENGIKKPHEFISLTLQEYKGLGFKEGQRKKDFDKKQIKLLKALEAMEEYNLFVNPKNNYQECKDSLNSTSKNIKSIT